MSNSKLIVVFGMQYGSEGKGDVCEYITRNDLKNEKRPIYSIRVGGANAGHSFIDISGNENMLQLLPVASFVSKAVTPVLGAGAVIHKEIFIDEVRRYKQLMGSNYNKILVDQRAVVSDDADIQAELGLKDSIGSTGKGVGSTTANKVMRKAKTMQDWYMSGEIPADVQQMIAVHDTVLRMNTHDNVVHMLECTQGFLLSLNVGGYYPFCTSRDCSPDAQLSSCGLSYRKYDELDIIGVARTFPIRVGGISGYIPNETSWEELATRFGNHIKPELTTVTRKVRRVGYWDTHTMGHVARVTRPTRVFLQFVDYLHPESSKLADGQTLPTNVLDTVKRFETDFGNITHISHIGVGKHHIVSVLKHHGKLPSNKITNGLMEPEEHKFITSSISRITTSDYPTVDEVMAKVKDIVENDLLPILQQRGKEYGEDVLVEMGESGILTMMLVKILRLRWSQENGKTTSSRADSYIDLAGYALLSYALNCY